MNIRAPWKAASVLGLGALLALAAFASAGVLDEFLPAVGVWRAEMDNGKEVLKVDGSAWKRGQVVPGFEQSAARMWGEKAGAFVKRVSSAANFPFAVFAGVHDFQGGTLTVCFKPLAGTSDQAGGILFDLKENGDYLVLRANALEDNLILFRYKDGRRSSLKAEGNAPAPRGAWNELKAEVKGDALKGYLNGKLLLEYTLDAPVSGKVGVWSKDDSVALFEGFIAQPAGK